MSLNYQTIETHLEIKSLSESGDIEGYGSVFGNVDLVGDVIHRGAFTKTLKEQKRILMLWQHNMSEPIGVWDQAYEDGYGLYMKGKLNLETQKGRECYALLKQGAMDGLSIGFMEMDGYYDDAGIRHITEVKLYEVSHVTLPANPDAGVMVVKDNGFESKIRREAQKKEQLAEQKKDIAELLDILKGKEKEVTVADLKELLEK